MRIEFFGNVLSTRNTTTFTVTGEYDGELNEARVTPTSSRSSTATHALHYKFLFNTKKNIGEFADGGVMLNRENC